MHLYPTEMCIDSRDRFLANIPWQEWNSKFLRLKIEA